MATQQDVQSNILLAQLNIANLVNANLIVLSGGGFKVRWDFIKRYQRALNCVTRQYNLGDYVSSGFTKAYDCLLNFIGVNTSNPINPNAQSSQFVVDIIVEGGGAIDYSYTEAYLMDAGGGNWYLPLLTPGTAPGVGQLPFVAGSTPIFVTLNGISFNPTYDTNASPARMYGFANNDAPQTIIVTILQASA